MHTMHPAEPSNGVVAWVALHVRTYAQSLLPVATTAIKQFLRLAVSFRQDAKLHLLRNERGHSIHWAIGLKQIQAAA